MYLQHPLRIGADDKYDVARIADAVAEADIVCIQEAVSRLAAKCLRRPDRRDRRPAQSLSLVSRRHGVRREHGRCGGDGSPIAAAASAMP